jgi:hypothetical protein
MITTEINVIAPLSVVFDGWVIPNEGGTHILWLSEPQSVNPEALQQQGWQAILNNFKSYLKQTVVG